MDIRWNSNYFRKRFNIDLDALKELGLQDTEQDMMMITNMQRAIRRMTKTCFSHCINVQNPQFTDGEEQCLKNCVKTGVNTFTNLVDEKNIYKPKDDDD